jgi:hypothetical protein
MKNGRNGSRIASARPVKRALSPARLMMVIVVPRRRATESMSSTATTQAVAAACQARQEAGAWRRTRHVAIHSFGGQHEPAEDPLSREERLRPAVAGRSDRTIGDAWRLKLSDSGAETPNQESDSRCLTSMPYERSTRPYWSPGSMRSRWATAAPSATTRTSAPFASVQTTSALASPSTAPEQHGRPHPVQ